MSKIRDEFPFSTRGMSDALRTDIEDLSRYAASAHWRVDKNGDPVSETNGDAEHWPDSRNEYINEHGGTLVTAEFETLLRLLARTKLIWPDKFEGGSLDDQVDVLTEELKILEKKEYEEYLERKKNGT